MAERVRHSVEEKVAEIDAKIAKRQEFIKDIEETAASKIAVHKGHIETLEAKKVALLNPKPRGGRKANPMKTVMDKLAAEGFTPEQIAEKMGITLE